MHYTIQQLASLAGISTRTLRYYDSIGLLAPAKTSDAGYRLYTAAEVNRLQQILFYRELELPLAEINKIVNSSDFSEEVALRNHLETLVQKQNRLSMLIENAKNTLQTLQGENTMTDAEKFEGFKEQSIQKNEEKYGAEIRAKYGDESIDLANAKKMNMSKEQYEQYVATEEELNTALRLAVASGDAASELAQKAAALHKEWLQFSLPNYSPEIHLEISQMYTADSRFSDYYEKIAPGSAEFLQQALAIYLKK